jgi:hypothetical protein
MRLLPRPLAFCAAAIALLGRVSAQQPAPMADPTKKNPPAEIVPAKPDLRPPGGAAKQVEPPSPANLSPGSRPADAPQPDDLSAIIGAMPEAELQQVLDALKQRYVDPAALNDLELKRAAVQGILARLSPGATLLAGPAPALEPSPLRTETLENRAGYVRLGNVSREMLAELDTALDGFSGQGLGHCILDLRATPHGTDFELAAEVCRRFAPKGKVLFTVRKQGVASEQVYTSKADPRFHGLPLILISSETAGTPEIIAAALRAQARAVVIGQRSKGQAAEFASVPLGGGRVLRLAVAEARFAGGESLLADGLTPDIPVEIAPDATAAVLKQELEKGVAWSLVEPDRPRFNEAALVAGTNPELDAMQAAQRLKGDKPKPILRDQTLLRALDLITSLSVLKQ